MATVTMTMEEYLQLLNDLSGNASLGVGKRDTADMTPPTPRKKKRKNPKLKRALIEANRRMRLKSGKLRKGKTQADVMRLAHRILKKM